jgi:quercetin dioxygenase-like cupin family protein
MTKLITTTLLCCAYLSAADDRVKIDNDAVRILKVVDAPHQKSALHRHEFNRVMIYLDAGEMEIIYEDSHKEKQRWKTGQVAWSAAGARHTSENVGSSPLRIVEIELKRPAPATAPVRKRELDPLAIDPKHNHRLFENDQVRVFRSWREPGAAEPMHEHVGAGRATVLLTDLDGSVKLADGTISELHGSAGDVLWSGPVTHSTTNRGSKTSEVIVVEVK